MSGAPWPTLHLLRKDYGFESRECRSTAVEFPQARAAGGRRRRSVDGGGPLADSRHPFQARRGRVRLHRLASRMRRASPYRDWIDQKPPGVFWVYRAALALPLNPVVAVHFAALFVSAASACTLFFVARRFMSCSPAAVAALLFAVLAADPLIQGTAANTEVFMLCPLILSQLAFFPAMQKGRGQILLAAACGALTGVAIAFKQVAAVNWLFLIAVACFSCQGSRLRGHALLCRVVDGGRPPRSGRASLPTSALRHGLADLVYNVFTHNLEYVQVMPWSARLTKLARTLGVLARSESVVWLLAAIGFVALGRTKQVEAVCVFGRLDGREHGRRERSGYFFPHYFQQILPPLAIAAALGAKRFTASPLGRGPLVVPGNRAGLAAGGPASGGHVPLSLRLHACRRGAKTLPRRRLRRNAGPCRATCANDGRGRSRFRVWGGTRSFVLRPARFGDPLHLPLSALRPLFRTRKETGRNRRRSRLRASGDGNRHSQSALQHARHEQFFTAWSQSYVQEKFTLDTCLTVDRQNIYHLVAAHDGQARVATGQKVLGGLFVRKRDGE